MDMLAPGLLSRRGVEEGSLGINITTCLLNVKMLFLSLLHAARCLELLEDDSL